MSDRAKEIRSKLSAASYIVENLPEYPGYNGSAFVIDDIEKDRIVKDLDEAIAFVEAAQAQAGDVALERYGLQWNGPANFVATPMADGYWTPWHIAQHALKAQAGDGESVGEVFEVLCEGRIVYVEVYDGAVIPHRAKIYTRQQPAQQVNQQLLEALRLADAALSGSNMNMKAVEAKVKAAISAAQEGK